jgi:hypothetical protein
VTVPPYWLVLLLSEVPAIAAAIDCWFRPPEQFAEGEADRVAWLRWLAVALITVPILIGYGIVLGYYFAVIKRNSPNSRP